MTEEKTEEKTGGSRTIIFAIGTGNEGIERRKFYEKAAVKKYGSIHGALSQWIKDILDKASGFKSGR